jgi:transposase
MGDDRFGFSQDRLHGADASGVVEKGDKVDSGKRAGVPTDMAEKLKALERENRELRQANEILRKASAYFAQAELDRRVKP